MSSISFAINHVIDFESQDLSNWVTTNSPLPSANNVQIVSGNLNGSGNYLLQSTVNNAGGNENDYTNVFYNPSLSWQDYDVSFDFKLVNHTYNYMLITFYAQSIVDGAAYNPNSYIFSVAPTQGRMSLNKMVNGVG